MHFRIFSSVLATRLHINIDRDVVSIEECKNKLKSEQKVIKVKRKTLHIIR